ncbi:MAG: hypothetical protein ACRDE8_06340, partial [Ginsengibacter sp.]
QINIILAGVFPMKVISFFSRFTVICNIAFLLFIFLGKMEAQKTVTEGRGTVVAVSYVKDIIITLGVGAIIINLVMCILYSVLIITGRQKMMPKYLAAINVLFLILQFLYFFYR